MKNNTFNGFSGRSEDDFKALVDNGQISQEQFDRVKQAMAGEQK